MNLLLKKEVIVPEKGGTTRKQRKIEVNKGKDVTKKGGYCYQIRKKENLLLFWENSIYFFK